MWNRAFKHSVFGALPILDSWGHILGAYCTQCPLVTPVGWKMSPRYRIVLGYQGRFYVGAGGTLAARFTCCPPNSKASWPFWCDFWGPKMLKNPNFPGLDRPGPCWRSLYRELTSLLRLLNWWGGGSLPLPRTPPRSRPFGPRFYGSHMDLTHYRVSNPTNDRFQM